jgi:hypothetical protein
MRLVHIHAVLLRLMPAVLAALSLIAVPAWAPAVGHLAGSSPHGSLNVLDFGAAADGDQDDGPALARAIGRARELAGRGIHAPIYLPTGTYKIATPIPAFFRGGSLLGDGVYKTFIVIDRHYAGDLFRWSESWMATDYLPHGQTLDIGSQRLGATIQGLTIIGDRSAPHQQNALVFYDRNDNVLMRDVAVHYLRGRCLQIGAIQAQSLSFMRESQFFNVECRDTGDRGIPSVEIAGSGSGDSTNQLYIYDLKIISPRGPGLVIRNANKSKALSNVFVFGMMIHGMHFIDAAGNALDGTEGDLLTIGDPAGSGKVGNVFLDGVSLNAAKDECWSIRFAASDPEGMPFNVVIRGAITSGANGIYVGAGRSLRFELTDVAVRDVAFKIDGPPKVQPNIEIDMNGREGQLKYDIDGRSLPYIAVPQRRYGDPAAGRVVDPVRQLLER